MKTQTVFPFVLTTLIIISCTQQDKGSEQIPGIENTLKSVSLWIDSIPADPVKLLGSFERINQAIDSIGYPDAGYKFWQVDSQDSLSFKFMIEGYWPDLETYEIIHEHELYKQVMEAEKSDFEGLKNTWYHRFKKVK